MSEEPLILPEARGSRRSNLAFALFFLSAGRRRDALLFYDFCRAMDDLADDEAKDLPARGVLLARWRRAMEGAESLPRALEELIARHKLDRALLAEIIRGMEMDLEITRYETFEELKAYCWRAACAVGLVSIRIFGCREPESAAYAENLGYALQLTNILRDVAEDAQRGRIYLPLEDLRNHGVSPESLLQGKPEGNFPGLMAFQAARAGGFFSAARRSLPAADAAALRCAKIMAEIYQALLTEMKRDGFRVFSTRYRLPFWRKLAIALKV